MDNFGKFEFHEQWKNPETGRMKKHVYLMDGVQMTGVTTVLGTIAKPALISWAADMTAQWIRENCDKNPETITTPTGATLYSVTEDNLKEAVKAHTKRKEAAGDAGTDMHAEVEEYIKHMLADFDGVAQKVNPGFSAGAQKFIDWAVANGIKFLASEKQVYSKEWFCAGTADFVFEKDGQVLIGDLKTMKKIWDKQPAFQVAAYAKMWTEMGNKPVDGTCIVNIAKETHELTEQWFHSLEEDTRCFEAALRLYRSLQNF